MGFFQISMENCSAIWSVTSLTQITFWLNAFGFPPNFKPILARENRFECLCALTQPDKLSPQEPKSFLGWKLLPSQNGVIFSVARKTRVGFSGWENALQFFMQKCWPEFSRGECALFCKHFVFFSFPAILISLKYMTHKNESVTLTVNLTDNLI